MATKKLSIQEVQHLQDLAKLSLSQQKMSEFQTELTAIVGYVSEVQKINLKGIAPTAQVTGKVDEFRPDQVTPSLSQEQALSQAKKHYKGFFVVPAVLKI